MACFLVLLKNIDRCVIMILKCACGWVSAVVSKAPHVGGFHMQCTKYNDDQILQLSAHP